MASSEKQPEKNHGEGVDRLSDLPDAVLLHILSFLPRTRQCVQTTVLSKRWKCLWTSLPVLLFDVCDNASFVRRVLSEREKLPLTKFSFSGVDKSIDSDIPRIIDYAVSHDLQHFSLCLNLASFTLLLPIFNICQSLKTLALQSFQNFHLLKDLTLPCLTTLYLFDCSFSAADDEPTVEPFVGLFNLKCLQLDYCDMGSIKNFKINGPQLYSLSISRPRSRPEDSKDEFSFEIVAPQLKFFSFRDNAQVRFSDLDFPLLECAEINVIVSRLDKPTKEKSVEYMIDFFRWLYHVQSLVLPPDIIECHGVFEDQASPFVRLKTLKVNYSSPSASSFKSPIPDNLIKYFGENTTIEKIKRAPAWGLGNWLASNMQNSRW